MANLARAEKPRCVAVLDLGSNTVILLTLERGGRVLQEDGKITRLGEGVFEAARLAPQAIARTRRVAIELAARAREAGAELVVAVGTEALRRAEDGPRFLEELRAEASLDQAILLSGREEAELAIEASRRSAGAKGGPLLVVDVGGGSTELSWLEPGGEVQGVSLPLGAVQLTEAFIDAHPTPPEQLERLRARARSEVARLADRDAAGLRADAAVIAVAGTATTLAALDLRLDPYDPERVEGYTLPRGRIQEWVERLAPMPLPERRALPGLEPGRADVILAGLVILQLILEQLGAPHFRVSGRGVRHGVALRLLEGRNPV